MANLQFKSTKELKISKDGVFNFEDLYRTVKDWLNLNKYEFFEKNYSEISKGDSKDIKAVFTCEKKIDDYLKSSLSISMKVNDHRIVISSDKKKRLVKGLLEISINSSITSDYQEQWEGKPLKKFIRGVYDKFVEGDRRSRVDKEIKEETYALFNEIKAFLNLQRF